MPDPKTFSPKRALLEGTVIVLSILLAFGIDAAWDNFKEREAEQRALETLAVEFRANLDEFHYAADWVNRNRAGAVATLEAARLSLAGQPASVPDSLLVYAVALGTSNPSTGALDGVLGAQGLELFSSPPLRAAIASWPGQLRDVLEDQADAHIRSCIVSELELHFDTSPYPAHHI